MSKEKHKGHPAPAWGQRTQKTFYYEVPISVFNAAQAIRAIRIKAYEEAESGEPIQADMTFSEDGRECRFRLQGLDHHQKPSGGFVAGYIHKGSQHTAIVEGISVIDQRKSRHFVMLWLMILLSIYAIIVLYGANIGAILGVTVLVLMLVAFGLSWYTSEENKILTELSRTMHTFNKVSHSQSRRQKTTRKHSQDT